MKIKLGIAVGIITASLFLSPAANAQAPSSIAGDGFLAGITSGVSPLASFGSYYLFIPANSGNTYQVIGIYSVNNSSGTYTYTPTSASAATLNVNDSLGGAAVLNASFASASSGSYYEYLSAYPYINQSGNFGFSYIDAPSSLAGRTFNCSVVNGASPFLTSGSSYTITIANSGNTYTVSTGQSGTYSYSTLNRSTGILQLNDSVNGATTAYFGFSSATGGGFAIKTASGIGYQVGTFALLDTTAPTVTITAPATGQRWSNSVFTVTGVASDNVQVATVYYQINSQGWNLASSANNWANWAVSIALLPGTNSIQAYSVDTSGNTSPMNTQNLFYVLPTPISVLLNGSGIISPNYDGQMLEIGNSYSMTATPSAGVTFTGWTGSLTTSSSTIQFLMASNFLLQANFVDAQRPTNSITSPTPGQLWSNGVFTVTGKATDNVAVSNVFYSLNNSPWMNATTANNWSDWAAAANLIVGTNTIQAYAVDASGNSSATNRISFKANLSTALQIRTVGMGTLSPNYSNVVLQIGKSYKMTAKPAKGFKFSNWTVSTNWIDGVMTNKAALSFTMASNLTLQVAFNDVTKPVLSITNLLAKQKISNAVFTVKGKATDNAQVANVWLQLNGADWTNAETLNQWTNWSADLNLVPGTNMLAVYAVDTTGNRSITNSRIFQCIIPITTIAKAFVVIPTNAFAISDWTYSPNGFGFTVQSADGLNGHIEMSTNLTSWNTITNFVGTNSTFIFSDPSAINSRQRFYRAVIP